MKTLRVVILPAVLALTLFACGEDETKVEPPPNPLSPWARVFQIGDSDTEADVSFSAPDDGWLCMYERVFHYDGKKWSLHTHLGKELNANALIDICAPASNDVWVGTTGQPDHLLHYDGNKWEITDFGESEAAMDVEYLEDLFFLSPNRGWAACRADDYIGGGIVFRYDGTEWTCLSYVDYVFEEIHFVSPNNGWAYGYDDNFKRHFFHYDGNDWEEVDLPGPAAEYYEVIKFCSPNDGWLLGRNDNGPVLYHYDGSNWTWVTCPENMKYLSKGDFVSADCFWIGGRGSWYYDGERFTPYPWPYEDEFAIKVYACSENDFWAVTDVKAKRMDILHFTGLK
jgi:hypothetical protein